MGLSCSGKAESRAYGSCVSFKRVCQNSQATHPLPYKYLHASKAFKISIPKRNRRH